MTLQQLEYIVAVDRYRQFVKAAEACGVTQSTLSSMIHKLEEELDITIFDRNNHSVRPTHVGEQIINQAKVVLFHSRQLQELSKSERQRSSGHINLGIIPTIAPYIIPKLFKYISAFPDVTLHATEVHRNKIIKRLKNAELDMAIMSMPHGMEGLLAIPLYRERFWAYVSPNDPLYEEKELTVKSMPMDRLWALRQEICFQQEMTYSCEQESLRDSIYDAGSIATLLGIVDENDGFTIIPELHIPSLPALRRKQLRPIVGKTPPQREVSLFVRNDYLHEGLLKIIVEGVMQIIPEHMLDERLFKYDIRL